jgi:hypothetical protein
MKIYYDETTGNYMTQQQFRMYASGYIDGLRDAGRPIDELPTISEVMLNADHIIMVANMEDCDANEYRKNGYQDGYDMETEARKHDN